MLIKKIIIILFFFTLTGSITFFVFWELPAPEQLIEKKIDLNRLNPND